MPADAAEARLHGRVLSADARGLAEAGDYFFVDRILDVISREESIISSADIESAVNGHPQVVESPAISVTSPDGDPAVKVVAVLERGVQLKPAELHEFLLPRVADGF